MEIRITFIEDVTEPKARTSANAHGLRVDRGATSWGRVDLWCDGFTAEDIADLKAALDEDDRVESYRVAE